MVVGAAGPDEVIGGALLALRAAGALAGFLFGTRALADDPTDPSAASEQTSQYTRQIGIDAYLREQQLAAARADASANGHHPDGGGGSGSSGGGLTGSELLAQQNRATGGSTTTSTTPNNFVANPGASSVVVGGGTKYVGAYTSYTGGTTTDHTATEDRRPILLDLNGNGIEIATLDRSTTFLDSNGDGLQHRTAWAGSGDGVLFYDAGNDGKISEKREYVFTEWDPTAKDDLAALRSRFDSNGDGKLTSADAEFGNFKVMVTNADGSQTAKTLTLLGITEINLKTDATLITFADGSQITGQTTFVMGGVTKTAAAVTLVSEADGHKLETTVDGATTANVARHVVRRRSLTGRRTRGQSVQIWTLRKLTESRRSVNFRSSNVEGSVWAESGRESAYGLLQARCLFPAFPVFSFRPYAHGGTEGKHEFPNLLGTHKGGWHEQDCGVFAMWDRKIS